MNNENTIKGALDCTGSEPWMDDKVECPYCGELNAWGSNICSRCFKTIRELANPERADFEQTAKTRTPSKKGLLRRIRRWWNRIKRNAR